MLKRRTKTSFLFNGILPTMVSNYGAISASKTAKNVQKTNSIKASGTVSRNHVAVMVRFLGALSFLLALMACLTPSISANIVSQERREFAFPDTSSDEDRRMLEAFIRWLLHSTSGTRNHLYDQLVQREGAERWLPQKRVAAGVLPFSGGIYGKRSVFSTGGELPFSGGIYGKRTAVLPFSGGIYDKRAVSIMPFSGGIYGKRNVTTDELDGEVNELRSRKAIAVRASAVPLNGGFYGRRR